MYSKRRRSQWQWSCGIALKTKQQSIRAARCAARTPEAMLSPLEVLRRYPPHDGTIASMLRSRVAVAGEREFIVYQGRSWSYAQVLDEVGRTAAVLGAKGVKMYDRVGVMSLNHPSSVFVFFALASLGAIMVPVNPDYGVEEARYVLLHAGVCGVICSPATLPTVRAACDKLETMPWLMLNQEGAE